MRDNISESLSPTGGRESKLRLPVEIGTPRECCNAKGAAWIKNKIEDYWRAKGYDVEVTLIPAVSGGGGSTFRAQSWRSNLVNGAPCVEPR